MNYALFSSHACGIYPLQKLQCAFVADVRAVDDERFGRGGGNFKEKGVLLGCQILFPRCAEDERFACRKLNCFNEFLHFVAVFFKVNIDAYAFRNIVFEIFGDGGTEFLRSVVGDYHALWDKTDLVGKKLAVSQA